MSRLSGWEQLKKNIKETLSSQALLTLAVVLAFVFFIGAGAQVLHGNYVISFALFVFLVWAWSKVQRKGS